METFTIDSFDEIAEVNAFLKDSKYPPEMGNDSVKSGNIEIKLPHSLKPYVDMGEYNSDLIFGKSRLRGVVAVEVVGNELQCYLNNGEIVKKPMIYWMTSPTRLDSKFERLKGGLHYKYIRYFRSEKTLRKAATKYKHKDKFLVWNAKEAAMIYYGITQFKGLKVKDVSCLSFDIESEGLIKHKDSKVFLITNTFRDTEGNVEKKHFRVDEYESDVEMIESWCSYVREKDPTILLGHNIYGYDLPYIQWCYSERNGGTKTLPLGKNASEISFNKTPSKFRVDGNNDWDYTKCHIPGRHLIDTMFLAVRYYIGKAPGSWGLKPIMDHEGLTREGRQFYDASKIKDDWYDPEKREKIIAYGIDDSDDALEVYDLMIPSMFYMAQSVPKPFQLMGVSASGSQLNAIMVRAYLQEGHSLPKADEVSYVAGGMSFGNPGIYHNVSKWDAKSYYPSTILAFDIYDHEKDPKAYYYEMVKYFTHKRFDQKEMYKKTGDKYYNDLQAASKIFINSAYGLMATNGLNFNSPENAKLITKCARMGLQKAVMWATGRDIHYWWDEYKSSRTHEQDFETCDYIDTKAVKSKERMGNHTWTLVNLDTDSLSFAKRDGSEFTKEEYQMIRRELNDIMYCEWEDDGQFECLVVLKAKNYIMREGDKIKLKGNSLTDSKKEPALKEFTRELCEDFTISGGEKAVYLYEKYMKEAAKIKDITRWATRKSVTKAVLNPSRTNEQKVLDAISHRDPREGDKFWLYSAITGTSVEYTKTGKEKQVPIKVLKCQDEYDNDHDIEHYLKRVRKTLEIFKPIIDLEDFPQYHLKSKKALLEQLLEE